MKLTTLIRTSLVAAVCLGTMIAATAGAAQHKAKATEPRERVILVDITGSRIPQRVVVKGQQVNSASPLYIVRGDELSRTGATSVYGMISLDPSVTLAGRSR